MVCRACRSPLFLAATTQFTSRPSAVAIASLPPAPSSPALPVAFLICTAPRSLGRELIAVI